MKNKEYSLLPIGTKVKLTDEFDSFFGGTFDEILVISEYLYTYEDKRFLYKLKLENSKTIERHGDYFCTHEVEPIKDIKASVKIIVEL